MDAAPSRPLTLLCVHSGALTLGHPTWFEPALFQAVLGGGHDQSVLGEPLCPVHSPGHRRPQWCRDVLPRNKSGGVFLDSPRPQPEGSIRSSHHTATGPPRQHPERWPCCLVTTMGSESPPVFRALFVQAQSSRESGPGRWETGLWPRADPSSSWAGRGVSGPFTCGFLGRHLNPSLALGAAFGQNRIGTRVWSRCRRSRAVR